MILRRISRRESERTIMGIYGWVVYKGVANAWFVIGDMVCSIRYPIMTG